MSVKKINTKQEVLALLTVDPRMTNKQLAEATNKHVKTIEYATRALRKDRDNVILEIDFEKKKSKVVLSRLCAPISRNLEDALGIPSVSACESMYPARKRLVFIISDSDGEK